MPANAATKPVNPKIPAIIARMRNVITNPNIVFNLLAESISERSLLNWQFLYFVSSGSK